MNMEATGSYKNKKIKNFENPRVQFLTDQTPRSVYAIWVKY